MPTPSTGSECGSSWFDSLFCHGCGQVVKVPTVQIDETPTVCEVPRVEEPTETQEGLRLPHIDTWKSCQWDDLLLPLHRFGSSSRSQMSMSVLQQTEKEDEEKPTKFSGNMSCSTTYTLGPLVATDGAADMTNSMMGNAMSLPDVDDVQSDAPFFKEHLPHVTLRDIRKLMRVSPFLLENLFSQEGAYDMSVFNWQESSSTPGTFVRGLRFMIPMPKDLPAALAKLVPVPTVTRATIVVSLKEAEDEVAMVYQTCTHDVPFGEAFRVQETLRMTPDEAGGITLDRWVEVAWVKNLPWGLGMVKTVVDKQVKSKAHGSHARILALLQRPTAGEK